MISSNRIKRGLALVLALVTALSFAAGALAWDEFPDVAGSWAEPFLRWAVDNKLLSGCDDGLLHPEWTLSGPQVLSILDRVFAPGRVASYASVGMTGEEWYAHGVAAAAAMGIDYSGIRLDDTPLTRGTTFRLLADAFQTAGAETDTSSLEVFIDARTLTGRARDAVASLVNAGYVSGSAGDMLDLDREITREEFVAILYRIAAGNGAKSPILTGKVELSGSTLTGTTWIGGSADKISLKDVKADTVIVRSRLADVQLSGSTSVDRLVIAGGEGNSLTMALPSTVRVGTLVIGSGAPKEIFVSGNVQKIEVTGSNESVSFTSRVQSVAVSGKKNRVDCTGVSQLDRALVTDSSERNTVVLPSSTTNVEVDGTNNKVTSSGAISDLSLGGYKCTAEGTGSVSRLTLLTRTSTSSLRNGTVVDKIDHGILQAIIELSVPSVLPAGETLVATAKITNPSYKTCSAVWSIDGEPVHEQLLTVTPQGSTATFRYDFKYSHDMDLNPKLALTLTYTEGEIVDSIVEQKTLNLENYDYVAYYQEALDTVTSKYVGDFTLEYAENNDYETYIKEAFVNAMGYSSPTEYLIWVNITYQRTNVFVGCEGQWQLVKEFIVATGAPGSGTPRGIYPVCGRKEKWNFGSYICRPIVRFKENSGYAFHSRLWAPDFKSLVSANIGFPVSHGCVRMYDEDVFWIYDNIPDRTTVVVY